MSAGLFHATARRRNIAKVIGDLLKRGQRFSNDRPNLGERLDQVVREELARRPSVKLELLGEIEERKVICESPFRDRIQKSQIQRRSALRQMGT
jgi:hypothetical protein